MAVGCVTLNGVGGGGGWLCAKRVELVQIWGTAGMLYVFMMEMGAMCGVPEISAITCDKKKTLF